MEDQETNLQLRYMNQEEEKSKDNFEMHAWRLGSSRLEEEIASPFAMRCMHDE